MKLSAFAAAVFALVSFASAQDTYRLNGVIKTKDLAVVPGLSLSIEKDGKDYERGGYRRGGFTDVNGHFLLELEPGKFKVTASGVPESVFALYLTIDAGPRPQDLELIIDPSSLCDTTGKFPSIITSATPVYPPAARAVRALGTVSVAVNIAPDGSVTSAKAISGHPLLRNASKVAAEKFLFEGSGGETERQLTLAFIFTDGVRSENVNRYECPSRIMVVAERPIIDTTGN